jgi:hypothetical protein
MRKTLRWLGWMMTLVTAACWIFTGRNSGWTKTSTQVKTVEEATGLEHIVWEKHFLPGVDFLAAGVLTGMVLFGASFGFRKAGTAPEASR